jgi:hypothetical protein
MDRLIRLLLLSANPLVAIDRSERIEVQPRRESLPSPTIKAESTFEPRRKNWVPTQPFRHLKPKR